MKKNFKLVLALVLSIMMIAGMIPAMADTTGTITVKNAAKGETYAIYKVLDATINTTGGINYTGTIPTEFADILETKTVGTTPNTYSAIGVKDGVTQEQINAALKEYVKNKESATSYDAVVEAKTFSAATAKQVADGNIVSFDVAPGFYVVVSSQGTNVMADSATNPATEINEKNTTTVTYQKAVEKESYSIGDTVKYTGTFQTANYVDGKPVTKYTISDTLPDFLSDATITEVTVGGTALTPTPTFTNKSFDITWATWDDTNKVWNSIYTNGATIVVKYQATLTSTTNIGKNDTNTISINPTLGEDNGNETPTEKDWKDDAEIKTYAAAIKKVDENDAPLAGAEFTVKGLIATAGEQDGVWIVSSYDATSTATPTTLTTDENGKLYIVGLASDVTLKVTEAKAPDGYNLMQGTMDLQPQLVETTKYKTETWEKYDPKGNLIDSKTTETTEYTKNIKSLADLDVSALKVINNKGAELPHTGGIGTTIFYIGGSVLVLAAAILLITKRRMGNND